MGVSSFLAGLQKPSEHSRSTGEDAVQLHKHDDRQSQNLEAHQDMVNGALDIPQLIPAWHVHASPATSRPSSASVRDRLAQSAGSSMDDARHLDDQGEPRARPSSPMIQGVPRRSSSLRSASNDGARQQRKRVVQRPELDRIDSERMPRDRSDDVPLKQAGPRTYHHVNDHLEHLSLESNDHQEKRGSQHEVATYPRTDDHVEQRSNPQHSKSSASKHAALVNQDLRLPPGFDLNDSVRTIVDTKWQPAVTREVIYRNTHEIRQEVITRDIHVHHYYTYIQPIKVVEILPAKHYILDATTGQKIEIAAPPGWQMPPSMMPHTPDTSAVRAATRHYLVNDQYPNGIIEPAPEVDGQENIHQLQDRITPQS